LTTVGRGGLPAIAHGVFTNITNELLEVLGEIEVLVSDALGLNIEFGDSDADGECEGAY